MIYRVEKVGKYLLSLAKKSIFSFLHLLILGVILKKLFSQGATSDLVQIFFYTLLGHIKNSQRTEF
jgi:hypothetical protein